ncbi:rCG24156, partial [Rattus norvegicus]
MYSPYKKEQQQIKQSSARANFSWIIDAVNKLAMHHLHPPSGRSTHPADAPPTQWTLHPSSGRSTHPEDAPCVLQLLTELKNKMKPIRNIQLLSHESFRQH